MSPFIIVFVIFCQFCQFQICNNVSFSASVQTLTMVFWKKFCKTLKRHKKWQQEKLALRVKTFSP